MMLHVETQVGKYVVRDTTTQDLCATVKYAKAVPVIQPLDTELLEQCLQMHRRRCSAAELEYMDAVDALGQRGRYPLLESIELSEGNGRLPTLEYTLCNRLTDASVTVTMKLPGTSPRLL